jgi:drug/metabolite transporter (DMT)-like permease
MSAPTNAPAHLHADPAATLAGVGAIALWSFSGVCYAGGGRTLGPMPYLCISSAVGVATIVVLRLVRRQSVRDLFRLPPRVAIAGFFGIVVYSLLLGSAMGLAAERDLAHVMLLNYLWPIWIVLLSLVLLKEPHHAARALGGAALGFCGVLLARGADAFHHPPAALLPHALAAGGGVLWALYSVLLRRWKVPAAQGGSTFQFLLLALVAGVLAAGQGAWHALAAADLRGLAFALFAGIGPVGLGYYWWEIGIKQGALHALAVLSYLIPIASALLIGVSYRESMGVLLIPGAMTIAAGAWLGQSTGRPRFTSPRVPALAENAANSTGPEIH